VPAGAIAEQHGDRTWRDLSADLLKMQIHTLGVRCGCNDGCADAACRADCAEQVSGVVAVVADHWGPRADWRPDVGQAAFLSDSGFVLKPDLNRLVGGFGRHDFLEARAEVFLNASCAAASFLGWKGRG